MGVGVGVCVREREREREVLKENNMRKKGHLFIFIVSCSCKPNLVKEKRGTSRLASAQEVWTQIFFVEISSFA